MDDAIVYEVNNEFFYRQIYSRVHHLHNQQCVFCYVYQLFQFFKVGDLNLVLGGAYIHK